MADTVRIVWDDAQWQADFARLSLRVGDTTPLMADIGEAMLESTKRRFDTGIGPDGREWQSLADGSGRTPLTLTGTLRNQNATDHGRDWAEIYNTMRQAAWHQEGTDPFLIVPKDKSALSWAGGMHPVRKVRHPGLPARPFIGVSAEDREMITALTAAYLDLSGGAREAPA